MEVLYHIGFCEGLGEMNSCWELINMVLVGSKQINAVERYTALICERCCVVSTNRFKQSVLR